MDGFQPAEKVPLKNSDQAHEESAHEADASLSASLGKVRHDHPEFLPLANMSFAEGAADVSTLKTRVFDLARTLEGLRSDVVFKAEKIKEGDQALQVLTTKIYEKQAVDLVHEIAKAKSEAAVTTHEMDRLRETQEKAQLKSQLAESQLRNEIGDLRLQCEALETEIDELEIEKANLLKENDNYKGHLTRLQDESWGNSIEAKRAVGHESSLQSTISNLNAVVVQRENEIARLTDKIIDLERGLNDQRLASETITLGFEKERSQLIKALSKAQDVVFEKQAESLQSKATVTELQKTIQALRSRPVEKVVVQVGQEFVDDLKIANTKLKSSLKEKEAAFVAASTEAAERTKEVSRLRAIENDLRSETAKLSRLESKLQTENKELSETLETLKNEIHEERAQLIKNERALRLEIETLRFESSEQDQSLSTLTQTSKDLERAFNDERTSFQARERELERAVSSLKAEVARAGAAAEQSAADLREFELQFLALTAKADEIRSEKEAAIRRADVSDARFQAMSERFESDRADFRNRLSQGEAEVTRLAKAITEKENAITLARTEAEAKKTEIAVLTAEIRDARNSLGRQTIGEVQTTTALRDQLARKEAELKAQTEAYTRIVTNRDELKEVVRELRSLVSAQEIQLKASHVQMSRELEITKAQAAKDSELTNAEAQRLIDLTRAEAARAVSEAKNDAVRTVSMIQRESVVDIEKARTDAEKKIESVRSVSDKLIEAARTNTRKMLEQATAHAARELEATKAEAIKARSEAILEKNALTEKMAKEIAHATEAAHAKVASEALLKVKATELVRQGEIEVSMLHAKIRDLEENGVQRLAKEKSEMEKQAARLELREQQLRHYTQTIQEERAEVVRCTQQLASEIHAARSMNPLDDYLKLTEFELSKLELQLKKTPTLSSERPKIEKFLTQMTEQRDFLQGVIAQSKANLDQQSKKLARIVEAARLSPLPPLPPKAK